MSTSFERIFRETLKDFRVSEGGQISGFCNSSEEFEELQNKLKSAGYSYAVRRSYHSKQSTDAGKSTKYFFQQCHGHVHINFFGPAFCVDGMINLQCILGPKYYKKKEIAVADHLEDHVNPRKKRLLIMDSKKSDCPATIHMKCVSVFPGYTIQSVNCHSEVKGKVLDRLRKELELAQKPDSYLRYYVVASPASVHTHSIESVEASGIIHPLLVKEIQKLVQDGTTSVRVIKLALDAFVTNTFTEALRPGRMNTTFYPTDKTVYNHVYRALYGQRKPVFDQSTLQNEITEWCKDSDSNKTCGIGFSKSCSVVRSHEVSSDEETNAQHDVPETSNRVSKFVRVRELCKHITNLTYNRSDENVHKYIEVLENLAHDLESENPIDGGLPLGVPSTSKL